MDDPFERPTIRTGVFYQEPDRALSWLEAAFGLKRLIDVRDKAGGLVHAEMRFGNCSIIVDGEWSGFVLSPQSIDGKTTQVVYIQIESGLDAHCARARENGADIVSEPEDQYYGDRIYRAKDLEGHIWTFSQVVRRVGRAEAERLGDVRITGWHSE